MTRSDLDIPRGRDELSVPRTETDDAVPRIRHRARFGFITSWARPGSAPGIMPASKGKRANEISLTGLAKRWWIVLVAVVVVAVAGFTVYRLHGIFGSHNQTSAVNDISNEIIPFNPKHAILEVFGPPGTVATINYQDVNAQPQRSEGAQLPWRYEITTTLTAVIANVVAQGNSSNIGCRITINGDVKDERIVNEVNAYTFCLDKSG